MSGGGSNCQYLKKLSIPNSFMSGVKSFAGVWILTMTTMTAYLTYRANYKGRDTVEKNKDQIDPDIYDLEDIVKKRAIKLYRKDTQSSKTKEVPDLKIDWTGVKRFPPDSKACTYSSFIENGEDNVFFKTVLRNDSKSDQQHNVRAERETSSVSECSLTAGFKIGAKVDLPLPAPKQIVNFSGEFSIEDVYENKEEKKLLAVAEDTINLPSGSIISVVMKLKERKMNYTFDTWMGFKGDVVGTFHNNQQIVRKITIPIETIFNEGIIPDTMKKEENGVHYIKVKGKCSFKDNIQHEIIISNDENV